MKLNIGLNLKRISPKKMPGGNFQYGVNIKSKGRVVIFAKNISQAKSKLMSDISKVVKMNKKYNDVYDFVKKKRK